MRFAEWCARLREDLHRKVCGDPLDNQPNFWDTPEDKQRKRRGRINEIARFIRDTPPGEIVSAKGVLHDEYEEAKRIVDQEWMLKAHANAILGRPRTTHCPFCASAVGVTYLVGSDLECPNGCGRFAGTPLDPWYRIMRSRNSRGSDRDLPRQPYSPPREKEVYTTPPPPVVLNGEPPVFNEASLTIEATAEVEFTETITLDSGDAPVLFLPIGFPDWLTIHPTTGAITGTPPSAAVFEYDLLAYNPYGVETETVTVDAVA